eukprot:gnl/MRDRNA2_/MRDRNA2_40606_c0_seq2.p1 gnl/MRDRNA2_/MRDRNA2_40606_c0~~gnl/MRDRNA2_/MRDRNA2_40606_c0_seq2.p1  ORF type:complete len:153 (-),score=27.32 gnl/MRDRNA2_/MRDRNA2_40606_c0_seq2:122-580(-)
MANREDGRELPFRFLAKICSLFFEMYGDAGKTAIALAMNPQFSGVLQAQMEAFNAPGADRIQAVREQISDIHDGMIQSIDQIMQRHEKINILVTKTEELSVGSATFRREASHLQQRMYWQNVRTYVMICGSLVAGIFILSWMFCGFSFQNCR